MSESESEKAYEIKQRTGYVMERQAGIEMLKGIGKKTSALFTKLNIATIDDLLKHYPLG